MNSEDLLEIGTDCFKFQTVWVCWFLGKNHSNFVLSLIKTLQSYYIGNKVCSEIKETTIWAGHFTAISGHSIANYSNIFHKIVVPTIILRCLPRLNIMWTKSYHKIAKNFDDCVFWFWKKKNRKYKFQNGHFWPFVVFFFGNYIVIFHKTEIQTVILRCSVCLNLNWIKSYDIIIG